MKPTEYYIGLMSGTSLDGVDAVLVQINGQHTELIDTHFTPFDNSIRQPLLALCRNQVTTVQSLAEWTVQLGRLFATSAKALLLKTGKKSTAISGIGSHGQTIWHAPNQSPACTWQIGDPNIIATQTGITTVADFRRKDVALGGQGAPLAPLFHQSIAPPSKLDQWFLNLGGIANLTYLPKSISSKPLGFDSGPANILLDAFYQLHQQGQYDADGLWAQQGNVNASLLKTMINDPYFKKPFPKSTGREHFNLTWLQHHLAQHPTICPRDIQCTLVELTAKTIAGAINTIPHQASHLWVCGGGAYNSFLLKRIAVHTNLNVNSTDCLGIAPEWVEACCFAWLAKQRLHNLPSHTTSITGASKNAVLGGVFYR